MPVVSPTPAPNELLKVMADGGTSGLLVVLGWCFAIHGGPADLALSLGMSPASAWVVLSVGLACVGLYMSLNECATSHAENSFAQNERGRECWECENAIEGEIAEMVELYVAQGVGESDAQAAVASMADNQPAFVDIMMLEELGIMPEEERKQFFLRGLVLCLSFWVVSSLLGLLLHTSSGHAMSTSAGEPVKGDFLWVASLPFPAALASPFVLVACLALLLVLSVLQAKANRTGVLRACAFLLSVTVAVCLLARLASVVVMGQVYPVLLHLARRDLVL